MSRARFARRASSAKAGGRAALTLFNQARALHARGALDAAVAGYRQALRAAPEFAAAHNNLGAALRALGRPDEAVASCRRAITLAPDSASAHTNLGCALQDLGRIAEAEAAFRRALAIQPDLAQARYNLGYALQSAGRLDEARGCYDRGLETVASAGGSQAPALRAEWATAYNNLGIAYKMRRELDAALACFERAIALHPGDAADARWNRSLTHLLRGDFAAAWPDFECRWSTPALAPFRRDFDRPLWDGAPLDGRTILLHAEQGLGDAIQFVRYAAHAAAAGGTVVVECEAALRRLFATCPGVHRVVVRGAPLPDFDVHAPLMSLPGLVGTRLESIPARVPYLAPPSTAPAGAAGPGLRVGLVWAASPLNPELGYRSCPFSDLEPMLAYPGVDFVSLQKGPAVADLSRHPAGRRVVELGSGFDDLADTAAAIAGLDLIISVDTSVAHLAGALGKPTWILLAYAADWRWFLERDDSPWYPTARLFRQPAPGDWPAVIAAVWAALDELAAERDRAGRG